MMLRIMAYIALLLLFLAKTSLASDDSNNNAAVDARAVYDERPFRYMYAAVIEELAQKVGSEQSLENTAKDLSLMVYYGSICGLGDLVSVINFKTVNDYTKGMRQSLKQGTGYLDADMVLEYPFLNREDLAVSATSEGWLQVTISEHALNRLPPDVALYLLQEFSVLRMDMVWEVTCNCALVFPFESTEEQRDYVNSLSVPDFMRFIPKPK
jgi:hypothetical protein